MFTKSKIAGGSNSEEGNLLLWTNIIELAIWQINGSRNLTQENEVMHDERTNKFVLSE